MSPRKEPFSYLTKATSFLIHRHLNPVTKQHLKKGLLAKNKITFGDIFTDIHRSNYLKKWL